MRWDGRKTRRFERLKSEGFSSSEIGESLGVSANVARKRSYKLGFRSIGDTWTEERTALLEKLHRDGESFSVIARRCSMLPGPPVTRNAAIGKALRCGLKRGKPVAKPAPRATRARIKRQLIPRRRVVLPTEPIPPPAETDVARKSFFELADSECKWVVGDPKPPHEKSFCALERLPGAPYCHGHYCRAYRTAEPTTREPQPAERELETA